MELLQQSFPSSSNDINRSVQESPEKSNSKKVNFGMMAHDKGRINLQNYLTQQHYFRERQLRIESDENNNKLNQNLN